MPRYEIVVSAENNHYLAWQSMLFHFSCVQHQRQTPLIMVHCDPGQPLCAGFERIRACGGRVTTAPNYRRWEGVNFPPRNTPASLKYVETDADYIVLCDCDMIFLQSLPFEELQFGPRQISVDSVGYLKPDYPPYQPQLDDTCRRAGVDPAKLRAIPIEGGVPHVIPHDLQRTLADDWLECLDLFPVVGPWDPAVSGVSATECHVGPQRDWLASMWGLIFSIHRLGLTTVLTHWCEFNHQGPTPLPPLDRTGPRLLHYCYGDERFTKRDYGTEQGAEHDVWNVAPLDDGTVHAELRRQLRLAARHYGLAQQETP